MLIVSCIFSILLLMLWKIFTIIILNYLLESLLISPLFIWSFEFLPCFFGCALFLSILFFLTYSIWSLLSQTLRFYLFFLLSFFFLLSVGKVASVVCVDFLLRWLEPCCSGGGEFCFLVFVFTDGQSCVRWHILECLWESCLLMLVFLLLSCLLFV